MTIGSGLLAASFSSAYAESDKVLIHLSRILTDGLVLEIQALQKRPSPKSSMDRGSPAGQARKSTGRHDVTQRCSPDNAACEGFFGRLKNEFFYSRD
jgi:hypothetical protein